MCCSFQKSAKEKKKNKIPLFHLAMFKSFILAASLATVQAWRRNVKGDKFQTEAYGADNQYYGTQGYGGYGKGKLGLGVNGNSAFNKSTSHNSYRQAGHQGHQNVSGAIGYTIGLGGHSFAYSPGSHSYGYDNREDYGYGGWANNLGAWNHGANYDNLGNQFVETGRDQYNDVRDRHDVKENRRVGPGYRDLEELDADDERQNQYANIRVGVSNRRTGTRNVLDQFSSTAPDVYGRGTAGRGVDVAGLKKGDIYDAQDSYGYGAGLGYGYGSGIGIGGLRGGIGYGSLGGYGKTELNNGVSGRGLGSYNDSGYDSGRGGYGKGYGGYGSRPLAGGLNGRMGGKKW